MILMGSYNMMGDNGNMFCCGNMIDDYNIIGIDNMMDGGNIVFFWFWNRPNNDMGWWRIT